MAVKEEETHELFSSQICWMDLFICLCLVLAFTLHGPALGQLLLCLLSSLILRCELKVERLYYHVGESRASGRLDENLIRHAVEHEQVCVCAWIRERVRCQYKYARLTAGV